MYTLPTQTTKMTGLRISERGLSFRKLSMIAGPTMARSKMPFLRGGRRLDRRLPVPAAESELRGWSSRVPHRERCSRMGPRASAGK